MNYYNKLLSHSLLSKEETYDLIISFQTTDDALVKQGAIDKLIRFNFKFIYRLTCKFYQAHPQCLFDDYLQQNCLAMIRTVEKFDIAKNLSLLTYYGWWSASFLSRYHQANSSAIRKPTHIHELFRNIKKVQAQYQKEHGTSPSISFVAETLDITPEKVRDTLGAIRSSVSLNVLANKSDSPTELMDLIADTGASTPNDFLTSIDLLDTLNTLLDTLEPSQRQALELRFGLTGNPPHSFRMKAQTLNAIGEVMGISRENARSLIARGTNNLRKNKDLSSLKQFL